MFSQTPTVFSILELLVITMLELFLNALFPIETTVLPSICDGITTSVPPPFSYVTFNPAVS